MSDLISRSATIRTMWDRYNSEYNDASKYDEDETKLANKIIADMQRIVEAEPIAYDIEKVVEQIGENGQKMAEAKANVLYGKSTPGCHNYYKAISVKKATDIIRKGGVNERD